MQIAIDGPASSGKSSVAKVLADKLNFIYIDTGAMYRAVTLAVIQSGRTLSEIPNLNDFLDNILISFGTGSKKGQVFLNQVDVTNEIRSEEVTLLVSEVSAVKEVREKMVDLQRKLASNSSVVMDGRDIGTVVFPQADFKFFLTASSKVRAERRYKENQLKGYSELSLEAIEQDIQRRDLYDSTREISPLKKAEDAIEIDTSSLNIDQVVDKILSYVMR